MAANHMQQDQKLFDIHLFVCTNQRELPKTGCGDLGSMDLHTVLKKEMKARNIDKKVRINKSGCLHMCEKGPVMVLYPEGRWFYNVTPSDIPGIVDILCK